MCQTCVYKRQTLLHMRSFALFPDLILLHAFQPFVHYDERQVWSRDGVAVGTAVQVDMGFFVCNLQPSPPDHVLWREYDSSCVAHGFSCGRSQWQGHMFKRSTQNPVLHPWMPAVSPWLVQKDSYCTYAVPFTHAI
ncbi:hypothetical protein H0G86_010738 [Trichoderma simmonsii]|uniref:Uncharacterized protein n=1 Tax=Trichoderma simmonsii TaxID=1491479 RepID=A0A8G0LPE8_9HYPO|nr:hypothetical protein H0G86_010738 [Trichoderma simmonsii]